HDFARPDRERDIGENGLARERLTEIACDDVGVDHPSPPMRCVEPRRRHPPQARAAAPRARAVRFAARAAPRVSPGATACDWALPPSSACRDCARARLPSLAGY